MSPAASRPRTLFRLIPGFMLVESLLKIEADRALTRHAELAYYQSALVRCDYPGRPIRPLRNHAPACIVDFVPLPDR